MTQHQIMLELLNEGRWVCTNEMYAKFIADPRTRICELKKQGYNLTPRPCENPTHNHKGGSKEWYLNLATTPNLPSTALKQTEPSLSTCCESSDLFKDKNGVPIHARGCIYTQVSQTIDDMENSVKGLF